MVRFPRNQELVDYVACRLRELRQERGLSQEKVLFETGIRVEHIELGRRNITISTLHALCTLYGVTLHEFFTSPAQPEETEVPQSNDAPESIGPNETTDDNEQETHS